MKVSNDSLAGSNIDYARRRMVYMYVMPEMVTIH